MGGVNNLYEQIMEVKDTSLATIGEFKVESPGTWQLVTGKDPN